MSNQKTNQEESLQALAKGDRKMKALRASLFQAAVLVLVLVVVLSGCTTSSTTTSSTTPTPTSGSGTTALSTMLRNTRYCEFYLQNPGAGGTIQVTIYNTTGLNDCPSPLFNALNPQALAKKFNVASVYLNAPRFWVIDQGVVTNLGGTLDFGGIPARKTGSATLNPPFPAPPYTDTKVNRSTQWFYLAGIPVYELISPTGTTYVMQSYAQIVNKNLTMNDLLSLGNQLQLPRGWKYQVQVLTQNLSLNSIPSGVVHVVMDNLQDTYQQPSGSIQ